MILLVCKMFLEDFFFLRKLIYMGSSQFFLLRSKSFYKNWFSVNRQSRKEILWVVLLRLGFPIVQCGVPDVRQARTGYAGLHISTLFPPASPATAHISPRHYQTLLHTNLLGYMTFMIVSARLSKLGPVSTNFTLQDQQKADDLLNVLRVCYLQFDRSDVNSASRLTQLD